MQFCVNFFEEFVPLFFIAYQKVTSACYNRRIAILLRRRDSDWTILLPPHRWAMPGPLMAHSTYHAMAHSVQEAYENP